jgi:hypothetical protein
MRFTRTARAMTSYVTDVEGSLEYFHNFLRVSKVLREERGRLEFRRPDDSFVFGGDCFDRGTGDLVIARMLVDFKIRHPDRVHLLLGNRDINKMKLTAELHSSELARKPRDVPRPYYIPSGVKFFSFADYIARHEIPPSQHHSAVPRLKWLLSHTMGCIPTFELRRQELSNASPGKDLAAISDEDVVRSFLDSTKPGGAVAEYLRHAQPVVVVEGTIFVHGAVNKHCVGFVPDVKAVLERPYFSEEDIAAHNSYSEEERIAIGTHPVPGADIIRHEGASIHDWVREMNKFAKQGVEEWLAHPTFDTDALPKPVAGGNTWGRRRGGSALIAYPHRGVMGKKTCIISTFVRNGNLHNVDLGTVACLNDCGISRVIVGHQPTGQTPSFIAQPGLQVICADNSYSALKASPLANGRGHAAAEVCIDSSRDVVIVNGQHVDGEPYSFEVKERDDIIGRRTADGWWSKAYRNDDSEVLMQRTGDAFYNTEYEWLPVGIARARLQEGAIIGGCGGSINWGLRTEDLRPRGSGCGTYKRDPNRPIKTKVAPITG